MKCTDGVKITEVQVPGHPEPLDLKEKRQRAQRARQANKANEGRIGQASASVAASTMSLSFAETLIRDGVVVQEKVLGQIGTPRYGQWDRTTALLVRYRTEYFWVERKESGYSPPAGARGSSWQESMHGAEEECFTCSHSLPEPADADDINPAWNDLKRTQQHSLQKKLKPQQTEHAQQPRSNVSPAVWDSWTCQSSVFFPRY